MGRRLPPYRPGMRTARLSMGALQWIGLFLACLRSFSIAVIQRGVLKLDSDGSMEAVSEAMKPGGQAMGWATGAVLCSLAATLAIPVFAKAAYEGWRRAGDPAKYLSGLALCALLSEIPYDFAMSGKLLDISVQNPVWGLLLAAAALEILKRRQPPAKAGRVLYQAVTIFAALAWTLLLRVYMGPILVLLMALFHFAKQRKAVMLLGGILLTLLQFPAPAGMAFVLCCDEEKPGGCEKQFLLLFPLQLAVFGLLGLLLT